MERESIPVKNGMQYDSLFPRAMMTTLIQKENATVADTIKFIPQVVQDTLFHTKKIASVLKSDTLYDTCHNIWDFVYRHIAYKKDDKGKEQVRSPARTWHDRGNDKGVDCDCYTVFISSILSNLNIPHKLRITKYKEDHFQHIYPIVPIGGGRYITIDCVVNQFDYEEPYSEKKDTTMDLEYLNGVGELSDTYNDKEGMTELNRLLNGTSLGEATHKKKGKFLEFLKKVAHFTNILNPATATIRAGILLSAKLNIMGVGSRLKWAYLSDEDAQKKGVDIKRFTKLKKVKNKLEKVFYAMGGKPANLKKAILTGRGNRHHEVSGLGYVPDEMDGIDENSNIQTILGVDMYQEELSGVENANDGLGFATAAAISSATGVIGLIAGLLKAVGSIFPKKHPTEEGGSNAGATADAGGGSDTGNTGGGDAGTSSSDGSDATNADAMVKSANNKLSNSKDAGSDVSGNSTADIGDDGSGTDNPSFWQKNKKWIKPTAFGLGGLAVLLTGIHLYKKHQQTQASTPLLLPPPKTTNTNQSVSGLSKRKKRGKKATRSKRKKAAVAWM